MRNHDVRSVGGRLSSFQDFRGGWLGPTAKAVGYGLSSLPGLIGAWWLDLRPQRVALLRHNIAQFGG